MPESQSLCGLGAKAKQIVDNVFNCFHIVEREVPEFYNNCALPDTSMTLSALVLQTFLITKSVLANAIISIFKMATMILKMAVKLIIIKQIKSNL